MSAPKQVRAPQLLAARHVAERLACSQRAAYDLMASGQFEVVRLGAKCVRVREDVLEAFVVSRTVAPVRARLRRPA